MKIRNVWLAGMLVFGLFFIVQESFALASDKDLKKFLGIWEVKIDESCNFDLLSNEPFKYSYNKVWTLYNFGSEKNPFSGEINYFVEGAEIDTNPVYIGEPEKRRVTIRFSLGQYQVFRITSASPFLPNEMKEDFLITSFSNDEFSGPVISDHCEGTIIGKRISTTNNSEIAVYDIATGELILPKLLANGYVFDNIRLKINGDGTWELVK